MNKVFLSGRLTAAPEARTTQGGLSVCSFTLAVDRTFKDADGNKQTDFIKIIAWRATADLCVKYLTKGSKIIVMGSMQARSYETQDGSKRHVTEVIADVVEFVETKPKGEYRPQEPESQEQFDDDELPF